MNEGRGEIERAALLVDAREGEQIEKLPGIYRKLRSRASRHAGVHRSERRSADAPLQRNAPAASAGPRRHRSPKAFAQSAAAWRRSGELADVVIDTTKFNVHELRQFIIDRFQKAGRRPLLFRSSASASATAFRPMPTWFSTCAFCRIRISFRACALSAVKIRRVARYIRSFPQTGRIPAPHREPAGLPDPALHPRREKLSDDRVRLHRRPAPFGALAEVIRRDLQHKGYATKVVHRDLDKIAVAQ